MGPDLLLAAVFGCGVCAVFARSPKDRFRSPNGFAAAAALLLTAGLFVRLYLGYTAQGFSTDIDTFKGWAMELNRVGFGQIYREEDLFLDYPPGYLYVLWALERLRRGLGLSWESTAYTLIIKLPAIVADLGCGCGLLLWGRRRLGESLALLTAGAFLFCPAVTVNSAQWGQIDSVSTLVLFAAVACLYRRRYLPAGALYGLGLALKPQALIFAPVFLFLALKRRAFGGLGVGIGAAVGTVLLLATPFTQGFDYLWLLQEYRTTLDSYNYYSVNAYNLWTLLGRNWWVLPEGNAAWVLSLAAPVAATICCAGLVFGSKREDAVFAAPAVLMGVMYLFGVKMHERYLYPVLLFLLVAFLCTRDRRLPRVFGLTAALHFLNVAHVLYLFRTVGGNYDPNASTTRLLAGVQVLALVGMLVTLGRIYLGGRVRPLPAARPRPAFVPREHAWRRGDTWAVSAVTLAYACFAFWGLGDLRSPQSAWTPEAGEQVTVAVAGQADQVVYFPGLTADRAHYAARVGVNVQVETSDDGRTWTDCGVLKDSGDYVFTWARHNLETPGRLVRFTALDGNTVLCELGLRSAGRKVYLPAQGSAGGQALLDESDCLPEWITYRNSAYFDEIYHARTAYEDLLGLEPYENTHPPLGKYLIAAGIAVFGMTPFGWRAAGAAFGVLMLPVLYHLLHQLFGRTSLCAAATLWFAFDCMHFTQTRIATVDTFAVFFILLMYDAMTAFLRQDLRTAPLGRLLRPLLVCGICTGLGIASKWNAAYAALGLAVLFFGKLGLSIRDGYRAKTGTGTLWARSWTLCSWCCLFFLGIPFGLYFGAFLPLTTLPHNIGNVWETFLRYQVTMFNYHATLVAQHAFASPWYEWPLLVRPIWFYVGEAPTGQYSTLASMGSPPVWWGGFLALFAAASAWVRRRELSAGVCLAGYLSVLLPWMLVPRLTFIYHYFAAVPFLVLALAGVFQQLARRPDLRKVWTVRTPSGTAVAEVTPYGLVLVGFTVLVLAAFWAFYPVISGAPAPRAYVEGLRLFPTWYF